MYCKYILVYLFFTRVPKTLRCLVLLFIYIEYIDLYLMDKHFHTKIAFLEISMNCNSEVWELHFNYTTVRLIQF